MTAIILPAPCTRRDALRKAWYAACKEAKSLFKKSEEYQPAIDALQHLQAHTEVCKDCQKSFRDSFPELRGAAVQFDNLSQTTLISD